MARYRALHQWDVDPQEAVRLQREFRAQLDLSPLDRPIRTIAGADISFNKYSDVIYAGVVVLELPGLQVIEETGVVGRATFPYIPGLLSFREAPCVLEAWQKLKIEPDAVMFDGQGIAHPRRMGIASHVGLFVDRPTVGAAKSVLTGKYEEPPRERGAWTPLIAQQETIGAALRTKTNVQPIFVSPGFRMDLPGAIALTLQCDGGYRQPEPTRRAHQLVNALRRGERSA